MGDSQKTLELVSSCFELIRNELDITDWLGKFAAAAGGESAICVRWGCGKPETEVFSSFGYYDSLPAGWVNWADHVAQVSGCKKVMLLDEMLAETGRLDLIDADPVKDPQLLVGLVDWFPAYIFMAVYRDEHLGPWSDAEREHFRDICDLTRRSALLHKDHATTHAMADSTLNILNSSPRGILSLSLDGKIHFANTAAEAILTANDGITSSNGKLTFADKSVQAELNEFLETVAILRPEQLVPDNPAASRDAKAKRKSDRKPYQLLFYVLAVSTWSVESLSSDRNVIVYIFDPQERIVPKTEQLQKYYGLTKAQAKVAINMYTHSNIVTVAEKLGISVNTARSHLRVIYSKTGANNQSDLISLLTSVIKTYETSKPEK